MTNGEKFEKLLNQTIRELEAAKQVTAGGDLWQTMVHLDTVIENAEEMRGLLLEVSKTAFERVFKERG